MSELITAIVAFPVDDTQVATTPGAFPFFFLLKQPELGSDLPDAEQILDEVKVVSAPVTGIELAQIGTWESGTLKAKRDLVFSEQITIPSNPGAFLVLDAAALTAVLEMLLYKHALGAGEEMAAGAAIKATRADQVYPID